MPGVAVFSHSCDEYDIVHIMAPDFIVAKTQLELETA